VRYGNSSAFTCHPVRCGTEINHERDQGNLTVQNVMNPTTRLEFPKYVNEHLNNRKVS
jgi:hypothetical protein